MIDPEYAESPEYLRECIAWLEDDVRRLRRLLLRRNRKLCGAMAQLGRVLAPVAAAKDHPKLSLLMRDIERYRRMEDAYRDALSTPPNEEEKE